MKSPKLITEVTTNSPDWKINHHAHVLTMGSCFAEVLGSQLKECRFPVLSNPFGTVFNPLTITKILDMALEGKAPNPDLFLIDADGILLHHDFHSSQWGADRTVFESQLATKLNQVRGFLKSSNVLVLTLGTAYAYRHKASNLIVGNCHKVPAEKFVKELLHPDQIMMSFEQILYKLLVFNRNLRIVVSVSPVRHTRDTLVLNQVSKSTLRLVCHRLSEKFKQIEYFPAYEIMVDELRDYRFYEADLIHPSAVAENYIFDNFANSFIEPASLEFMKKWLEIRRMMNHRPQHGFTVSHLKMLKSVQHKLSEMADAVDVSMEIEEINRRIGEFPGY